MTYQIDSSNRYNITLYKNAYLVLRLNHQSMLEGKGTDHGQIVVLVERIGATLPGAVVLAIEASIDAAFPQIDRRIQA